MKFDVGDSITVKQGKNATKPTLMLVGTRDWSYLIKITYASQSSMVKFLLLKKSCSGSSEDLSYSKIETAKQ